MTRSVTGRWVKFLEIHFLLRVPRQQFTELQICLLINMGRHILTLFPPIWMSHGLLHLQSCSRILTLIPRSLWAQAAAALEPSDQLPFSLNDPTIPTSVDDVISSAKHLQDTCQSKLWRYKNRKGEEIILRDVCAKIVVWVNKFKEVGDTIVQYNPVHAALPWAAVRFLLQISLSDQQTFGAMAEGLEVVSNLITRCRIWEQLYLTKTSTLNSQLTETLLKLYKSVLIYLGKVGKYYSQNTAGKHQNCEGTFMIMFAYSPFTHPLSPCSCSLYIYPLTSE